MLNDASDLAKKFREAFDGKDAPADKDIAAACGVTVQAVSGWRKTGRLHKRHIPILARLSKRPETWWLGSPGGPTEPIGGDDPKIRRLILSFGWLTASEQKAVLQKLESRAETNKAISRELGAKWDYKSDEAVGKHIKPAPKVEPKVKRRAHKPGRELGDAMGDFLDD